MSKSYGHVFSKDVPADGGKPKVCPKCDLWFSQQPRQRLCTACRPRYLKTRTAIPKPPVKSANDQVRESEIRAVAAHVYNRWALPGIAPDASAETAFGRQYREAGKAAARRRAEYASADLCLMMTAEMELEVSGFRRPVEPMVWR